LQKSLLNKRRVIADNIIKIHKEVLLMLDKIALTLLIIGGLNWGCVGIFQFDLVAWLFGGQTGIISRIVYILVGLAAIWCISLLFRDTGENATDDSVSHTHA
jgi:hypothetical protein